MALRIPSRTARLRRWCCASLLVVVPTSGAALIAATEFRGPSGEVSLTRAVGVQVAAVQRGGQSRIMRLPAIHAPSVATPIRLPSVPAVRLPVTTPFTTKASGARASLPQGVAVPQPTPKIASRSPSLRLPDQRSLVATPPIPSFSILVRKPEARVALRSEPPAQPAAQPAAEVTGKRELPEDQLVGERPVPGFRGVSADDPLNKVPEPSRHDWRDPTSRLVAAEELAAQHVQRASSRASRGALYSAQQDLESGILVIAEALDAHYETTGFTDCLRDGMLALEEVADFTPAQASPRTVVDVKLAVARHRSRIVSAEEVKDLSPAEIAARYYAHAQEHLVAAVGGSRVAAHAFFGMGKLCLAMADGQGDLERLRAARGLVLQQAAVLVDGSHAQAAEELGVLLARLGRWSESRVALQRSVAAGGSASSWERLAEVHERLGELQLAQQARQQAALAGGAAGAAGNLTIAPNGLTVRWVDKTTFEQSGGSVTPAVPVVPPSAGVPMTAARPVRAKNW